MKGIKKQYSQQPKDLFGVGKAEVYLVDTLNKLQSSRVLARCMDMISSARAGANKLLAAGMQGHLETDQALHLLRLVMTDQSARFAVRNKALDVEFKSWVPELSDEGVEAKRLEVLALKLAMNVATAANRYAHDCLQKRRSAEISRARRLAQTLKDAGLPSDLALTDAQVTKIRTYMKGRK
jgi:hypothetical protein